MNEQKIALVTGAGKRLGKAIAKGLAEKGYAIGLHYNSSIDGAKDLYEEIRAQGGRAVLLQKDLNEPETAGELVAETAKAFAAPVSVLINSASAFDTDNLTELTGQSWQELMNVNATAPVFLMQAFANQDPAPCKGAIVNMLDTQMVSAAPERFSYFCSKYALEGATRVAAYDLGPKGIRVNAIAPGLILPSDQTQENFDSRQQLTPLGAGLGPADVMGAVSYLISAVQVTGHTLVVDAGQRLMGFGNAPIGAK